MITIYQYSYCHCLCLQVTKCKVFSHYDPQLGHAHSDAYVLQRTETQLLLSYPGRSQRRTHTLQNCIGQERIRRPL